MSAAAAMQPAQAKAPAPAAAPPALAPMIDSGAVESGPMASLSLVPAIAPASPPPPADASPANASVQRKCAACAMEEEDSLAAQVQPKLEVGAANDPFEREADAIAGEVMAMREADIAPPIIGARAEAAPALVQRACAACSASKDDQIFARRITETASQDEDDVPRMRFAYGSEGESIAASPSQLTSGGSALPAATRQFFEPRMGRDLSGVRVHIGKQAQALSRSIGARAFTYQSHIWLGSGETSGPSFTMAHELAHVLQQTSPGPVGPQGTAYASREDAHNQGLSIRRKSITEVTDEAEPYFAPRTAGSSRDLHSEKHKEAQAALQSKRLNPGLLTEVPMPGADRDKIEIGERYGYADLYYARLPGGKPNSKAAVVPGVQATTGSSVKTLANFTNRDEPATVTGPGNKTIAVTKGKKVGVVGIGGVSSFESARAPKIDWASETLTDTDRMPTAIKLGEVKSAHSISYRRSGIKQLNNYIAGINAAAASANADYPGTNWRPNPTRMKEGDIKLPKSWDPSHKHTRWPVKDIEIRWSNKVKYDDSTTGRRTFSTGPSKSVPKPDTIAGRWMISKGSRRKDGGTGLFVYYLSPKPSDLKKALKNGNLNQDFERKLAVMHQIPARLRKPPTKASKAAAKASPLRHHRGAAPDRHMLPTCAYHPGHLAAADRPVVRRKAMKDDFTANSWEAFRRGKKGMPAESKNNVLDKLHEVAPKDILDMVNRRAALAEWATANPDNAPIPTDVSSEARDVKPRREFKILQKAAFWTSSTARPFGILRQKFGGMVVKGINKFEEFKAKVQAKMEERKKKALARNKNKRGKVIMKAAKAVMAALIPVLIAPLVRQTFALIMDCVEQGFKAKFASLFPDDSPIETLQEMVNGLQAKVDAMATDIEATIDAAVTQIVGEYEGKVDAIITQSKNVLAVVGLIKDLANGLRIGACLVSLATAPETLGLGAVVGCGFAVADWILSKLGMSPIDYIISLTIQTCNNKNRIGRLMAGFDLVKSLPETLAQISVGKIRGALKSYAPKGTMGGKTFGEHAEELMCNPGSIKATAEPFKPIDCSKTGSGSETVPDIPQSVKDKAFKDSDKVTANEKKHMEGRSEQVPPKKAEDAPTESPGGGEEKKEPDLSKFRDATRHGIPEMAEKGDLDTITGHVICRYRVTGMRTVKVKDTVDTQIRIQARCRDDKQPSRLYGPQWISDATIKLIPKSDPPRVEFSTTQVRKLRSAAGEPGPADQLRVDPNRQLEGSVSDSVAKRLRGKK